MKSNVTIVAVSLFFSQAVFGTDVIQNGRFDTNPIVGAIPESWYGDAVTEDVAGNYMARFDMMPSTALFWQILNHPSLVQSAYGWGWGQYLEFGSVLDAGVALEVRISSTPSWTFIIDATPFLREWTFIVPLDLIIHASDTVCFTAYGPPESVVRLDDVLLDIFLHPGGTPAPTGTGTPTPTGAATSTPTQSPIPTFSHTPTGTASPSGRSAIDEAIWRDYYR